MLGLINSVSREQSVSWTDLRQASVKGDAKGELTLHSAHSGEPDKKNGHVMSWRRLLVHLIVCAVRRVSLSVRMHDPDKRHYSRFLKVNGMRGGYGLAKEIRGFRIGRF